jgi:putative redox protein
VVALLGCTSYDVVDILRKQRENVTALTVTADAKQAPEPPWQFTEIHMHYVVTGVDLDPKKVERAIKLSEDKYCSVAATIRGVTKLSYTFEVRSAS